MGVSPLGQPAEAGRKADPRGKKILKSSPNYKA